MKTIGFLTRHGDDPFSEDFHSLVAGDKPHPKREMVLKYLKRGLLCVSFMGAVEDEDPTEEDLTDEDFEGEDIVESSFIAYLSVYTDGVWLWPQYFIAYLEKYPNYQIDEEFVAHVERNKDKEIEVSEEELRKLELDYLKAAGFRLDDPE